MAVSDDLDLALTLEGRRQESQHRSAVKLTLASLIALMMLWCRRSEGRRAIRSMTSEQLRDLDLDVAALRRESDKPFWRG
jgi:uncharacterized protein YjiS (DUF1127 family)